MVFVMLSKSVLSQDLFQGALQENSLPPASDYDIKIAPLFFLSFTNFLKQSIL